MTKKSASGFPDMLLIESNESGNTTFSVADGSGSGILSAVSWEGGDGEGRSAGSGAEKVVRALRALEMLNAIYAELESQVVPSAKDGTATMEQAAILRAGDDRRLADLLLMLVRGKEQVDADIQVLQAPDVGMPTPGH